jgi:glutamine synthetase
MLMAGLDGIKNKIDPGKAADKNLYALPEAELRDIPRVARSLHEALDCLDKDREFLKAGGVFKDDQIDSYLRLKIQEVIEWEATPHPIEFINSYSS